MIELVNNTEIKYMDINGVSYKIGEPIFDIDFDGKHFSTIIPTLIRNDDGSISPFLICYTNPINTNINDSNTYANYTNSEKERYIIEFGEE